MNAPRWSIWLANLDPVVGCGAGQNQTRAGNQRQLPEQHPAGG